MTGFEAYRAYQGIRMHFTSESYDYFKYNRKTRCSVESFDIRRDKIFFHKLSRTHKEINKLEYFLAASFFSNQKIWVKDLFTDEIFENYVYRKKIKESLEYSVKENLENAGIITIEILKDSIFNFNETYPSLLQKNIHGIILPETLIVIDCLMGCLDMWGNNISDTIIYPKIKLRCKRYVPFLEIDVKNVSSALRKFFVHNK